MLTELKQVQQKYGGANKAIDNWLEERRELLVRYCKLAGLLPKEARNNTIENSDVIGFCQVLVDYLSAGHFEVFDDIASKCETHGGESLELARTLWPKINETTDIALNFNDKYAEVNDETNWEAFSTDLSNLVEALEDRFSYEDKLIHALYTKHTQVA
ncbi:sigma D regulator [Catenovulum adriaticum]|uniref:Sigma D regulator n=1 Tax=Catenovulum adriaticum TaxID=2984846 RepID=A0ABY7AK69_9ALTE|nr:sigma D regulator [Catenovulum sp. TS8]WAJ69963.1 sigma D regulator [Catenovulum sp. TS8]